MISSSLGNLSVEVFTVMTFDVFWTNIMVDLIMVIKGTPHTLILRQITSLIQGFGAGFSHEKLFDINEVEIPSLNLHLNCRPFFCKRSRYDPGLFSLFKLGVEPASSWSIQIESEALSY